MTRFLRALAIHFAAVVLVVASLATWTTASALEPVDVGDNFTAVDLTGVIDLYPEAGQGISLTAAPDANGVVNRIEVRSESEDGSGNWLAFALANTSDRQVDRLLVAPHYRLPGSGVMWPDLGQARIVSVTPSEGFSLDREQAEDADLFLITLNPETVVTFVAEMAGDKVPKLTLWEPDAYKDAVNSTTLYNGIVLGIAGLLALFLTILFVVKGSAMFPATAALAWGVLAYVCVDFGFIGKIVSLEPGELNVYRALTEVFLAGGLVIFLWAYLHLNRWDRRSTYVIVIWLLVLGILMLFAPAAAEQVSGIARMSLVVATAMGLILIVSLALMGFDRAVLLVPTWLLISAWLICGWLTITGRLDNDILQPALGGGLVLAVLLISFTVMQHAFAGGVILPGAVSETERQALALVGSGDAVWDWDVDRDEVFVGSEVSDALGIDNDQISGSPDNWLSLLHPLDRDRYKSCLDVVLDHRRGRVDQDFRLRGSSGQYHWVNLRARPVIGNDGEVQRCVGTLSDVTEHRISRQRLMQDAVRDNLTGLPNKQLFLDRLAHAISLARAEQNARPSLFVIDLTPLQGVNPSVGLAISDSVLLTVTRRLSRLLKPRDTLARLSDDRFALLLQSENEPDRIAIFARELKKALNAPVTFSKQEFTITASIGLITWGNEQSGAEEMMRDAELAAMQAKRLGGDRIEPFRPNFRDQVDGDTQLENDLQNAIMVGEIEIVYRPIVGLKDRQIAGLEGQLRWQHPRRGRIAAAHFLPIAERVGMADKIAVFVLQRTAADLLSWQEDYGRDDLFATVDITAQRLLGPDLVNDLKGVLETSPVPAGSLKLEMSEDLVMDNPEQSREILAGLAGLGVGLTLDEFGKGFSSHLHLMQFPFDTMRIDNALIAKNDVTGRPAVLRSIVTMAHDLDMKVIAEGVRSEADAQELLQLGCEYGQGPRFGTVMHAGGVAGALRHSSAA
jgi:diguanylate cyclase (GGDEF)-like protein/PAS domain S-box-containing protein